MAGERTEGRPAWFPERDRYVIAALVAVSVLVRLAFLRTFDLVSFDGTFYINQARALWSGAPLPGQFPTGYPLLISLLLPVVRDGVIAAQLVSFAAGLGSLVALYFLGRRFLPRHLAFYAAAILAVTPLFIRLSLATFSESAYVFWMLLTLVLFGRRGGAGANLATGLAAGMATITRNEMLAVVALLALLRAGVPPKRAGIRGAAFLLLGFAIMYSVNVAAFYRSNGELVLMQKTEFFGTRAQAWVERERSVEDAVSGRSGAGDAAPTAAEIARNYVAKLPLDLWTLSRHAAVLAVLLAVVGALRRPSWVLTSLVPLLAVPLFTVRVTDRYLLPYLPAIILYGVIGARLLGTVRMRRGALLALGAAAVAGSAWNADRLTTPVDDALPAHRDVGRRLGAYVTPGDRVADRKPYIPFYAGGRYVEIPNDTYEDVMAYLVRENVRFLSLEYNVAMAVRPALTPLLTDPAAILGEVRFTQLFRHPDGMLVYERAGATAAVLWTRLATAEAATRFASPTWSPDGRRILFSLKDENTSTIVAIPAAGGAVPATVVSTPGRDDHAVFSPDGTLLAFSSTMAGNYDVYTCDVATGEISRLTNHNANDAVPSWFPDGSVVFVSERSGRKELWRIEAGTAGAVRLTDNGGVNFPAVSPSGRRVAFVRASAGVEVLDVESGQIRALPGPPGVRYAPAWSPDGRFLAVTASDGAGTDVYLLMPDTGRHLLLTHNNAPDGHRRFTGYPAYSPDGRRLAVVSNHEGPFALYILEGLEPYYERLADPVAVTTFDE